MNKAQFLEVLEILSDFYEKTPPKKQLESWYGKLGHLNADVARDAADECTSHMRDFPTPAKFLEFADQVRERVRYREVMRENSTAKELLNPSRHNPGLARDCVVSLNKFIELGNSESAVTEKYKITTELAKKYPHLDWKPNLRELVTKLESFKQKEAV